MKVNNENCELIYAVYLKRKRKLEIAQDYVSIYRNKRLSARTSKSKAEYYRKEKKWANRVIKLKRMVSYGDHDVQLCKRRGYL